MKISKSVNAKTEKRLRYYLTEKRNYEENITVNLAENMRKYVPRLLPHDIRDRMRKMNTNSNNAAQRL